jgi:hydrogenase maturation protease
MNSASVRVLVLGLGNDLLGDDAVGLHIARSLRLRLAGLEGCVVRETMEMGLALLDEIVGCEHLLLVDAIETGSVEPGSLHEFDGASLLGRRISAPHFVGVAETLALGRTLGFAMPSDVRVFAVEVKDSWTLGVSLTPDVQRSVEVATERIGSWVIGLLAPTTSQSSGKPAVSIESDRPVDLQFIRR